jgi:ubiquitin-protein ligase
MIDLFLATANYIDKLMVPLLARFLVLNIPEYTKEQFFEISIELLQKQYAKTWNIAQYITSEVWRIYTEIRHENPNMRQCVQVAVITENDKKQIDRIIKGLTTYSKKYE